MAVLIKSIIFSFVDLFFIKEIPERFMFKLDVCFFNFLMTISEISVPLVNRAFHNLFYRLSV